MSTGQVTDAHRFAELRGCSYTYSEAGVERRSLVEVVETDEDSTQLRKLQNPRRHRRSPATALEQAARTSPFTTPTVAAEGNNSFLSSETRKPSAFTAERIQSKIPHEVFFVLFSLTTQSGCVARRNAWFLANVLHASMTRRRTKTRFTAAFPSRNVLEKIIARIYQRTHCMRSGLRLSAESSQGSIFVQSNLSWNEQRCISAHTFGRTIHSWLVDSCCSFVNILLSYPAFEI
ncbi:hypothetical protein F5878DRAFT_25528 [Lentinula raphanica]|uniref:Uncharacterized protein n=1 Tax=Lentinula raphanica TaxID=153919 RepID=A0AA38PE62_9AGAR|nr:hypothetical protein F5878DRAFT_25528 [Lentinula raphanica]